MQSRPVDTLAELLRHAGFLRELARALCADGASADDLQQDVWLRALRAAPDRCASPRGLLTTLARRLAANTRRDDGRRRARELARSDPPPTPTPDAVLAAEQVRELVVRAVLATPEPFRDVLLLRFWEGLPPRAIATRLRVPGATVRTRLLRGLAHVRERLDAAHGGDRSEWRLALAPWLAARAASPFPLLVLTMQKLLVGSLGAALFALLVFFAWPATATAPSPSPVGPAAPGVVADFAPGEAPAAPSLPRAPARPEGRGAALDAAGESRVFPAERGAGALLGSVLDDAGDAAAGVVVEATPTVGHAAPGLVIDDDRTGVHRATTDAHGGFRLDGLPAGPFRVAARRGRDADERWLVVGDRGEDTVQLQLRAPPSPGDDVRVLVVGAAGAPVEGADVQVFAWSPRTIDAVATARSDREPIWRGRSDANGRAAAVGLAIERGVVWSEMADGRAGWAAFAGEPHRLAIDVVVVVAAPGALELRLHGVPAADLVGATLTLHAMAHPSAYGAMAGRSLPFPLTGDVLLVPALPAGDFALSLSAPRAAAHGARLVTVPVAGYGATAMANSVALPQVTIATGATAKVALEVAAGGAIAGTVRCAERPVRGARVRATLVPGTTNYPAGVVPNGVHVWRLDGAHENAPPAPIATAIAHTDDVGRYELAGLTPGAWRVEVATPALSFDRRERVDVDAGVAVELQHELAPAGVLQVALVDATLLGIMRGDAAEPTMLAFVRDGFATFPALAPGRYRVARWHTDGRVAPVIVGAGEVVAGRTTWLDLRAASERGVLSGRVRAGAEPVANAPLRLGHSRAITGADGSFRMALGTPVHLVGDAHTPSLIVERRGMGWSFGLRTDGPVAAHTVELQLGSHHLDVLLAGADAAPERRFAARWEADGADGVRPDGALLPREVWGKGPLLGDRLRLGPFPPGTVRGTLLVGGLQLPFTAPVPGDCPVAVACPPSATFVVRARRAGRPVPGASIGAATWRGPGAPPPTRFAWSENAWLVQAAADGDGMVVLTVAAGEVAVFDEHAGGDRVAARLSLAAGITTEVTVDLPGVRGR